MKKFEFRLKTVQRLKEQKVEEIVRKVQLQESQLRKEQSYLKDLHQNKTDLRVERLEYQRRLQWKMVEHSMAFEVGLDNRIAAQEVVIQDCYTRLKELREEQVEALKEQRVYDKLEEKARKEYKKERNHFEQKFLDDLTSMRTGETRG